MIDKQFLEKIVKGLWESYSQEIKSGMPVYFCFHRLQILQIMRNAGFRSPEAFERFLEISRSFLRINREFCDIDASIYDPVWNEYSSVIILIAAQVAAVELMDKNELGVGADAYYLKLRRLISNELAPVSRLPFNDREYLTIWDYFQREIVLFGGKPETVTFAEGNSRKDKNRNFPISQSLLSQAELVTVSTIIFGVTRSIPRLNEIPEILLKIRSDLPSRVRFKVDRASHKFKITEQIHTFYRKYGAIERAQKPHLVRGVSLPGTVSIRGFLEGFSEEVCIFEAWDEFGGRADMQIETVRQYFETKPIAILGRKSRNDFYWTSEINGSLNELEDFLVVFSENKKSVFEYFAENHIGNEVKEDIVNCDLQGVVVIRFEKHDVSSNCIIRRGTPTSGIAPSTELVVLGGIHLDYGNFLSGFVITGFSTNGKKVAEQDLISLDGINMKAVDVLFKINNAEPGIRHLVEYNGARKSVCLVARGGKREGEYVRYGHKIENDVLEPSKSELQQTDTFIAGFGVTNNKIFPAISKIHNYLALIKRAQVESGVSLTKIQQEKVLLAISLLKVEPHLKKVMERNVTTTGKVPAQIFSFL